jgi:hypothetical protein
MGMPLSVRLALGTDRLFRIDLPLIREEKNGVDTAAGMSIAISSSSSCPDRILPVLRGPVSCIAGLVAFYITTLVILINTERQPVSLLLQVFRGIMGDTSAAFVAVLITNLFKIVLNDFEDFSSG